MVLLAIGLSPVACDQRPRDESSGRSSAREAVIIDAPGPRPEYTIDEELRHDHPDVAAFVERFLDTCLSGNYTEYRLLVSRTHVPESRERFEAIYRGLKSVTVEAIRPLEPTPALPLPAPAYLVTSRLEVRPDTRLEDRAPRTRIAIIVFREEGEWRMLPAPAELQPAEAATVDSDPGAPAPQEPDFPWDQDGDG